MSQLDPATRNSEVFLVNAYVNGLQTAVRESIQYLLLPTLRENMTRAALYDSTHPSKRNGNFQSSAVNAVNPFARRNHRNGNGNGNGNGNVDRRNKDGFKGQFSSQGQSINNANPARQSMVCTHCKKNGHTFDKCFQLHPELRQKSKNSDSGAQSNRGKQSSSNSAKVRSANFSETVKDQSSVLTITSAVSSDKPGDVFCRIIVEIDGHPLECIIDSGALTTVIPAKFASEYGLKLKPDKVLCQVANGKTEYTPITYACDVIIVVQLPL
jgi:hypothetical protein